MKALSELITSEINLLSAIRKSYKIDIIQYALTLMLSDLIKLQNVGIDITEIAHDNAIANILKQMKAVSSTSQYSYNYDEDLSSYIFANINTAIGLRSNGNEFLLVTKYA